jgi:hypothetical protein
MIRIPYLGRATPAGIGAALFLAGCVATSAPTGLASAVPTGASSTVSAGRSPGPSLAPAPPSALEVECNETGTRVVTDTVAAQPDGVHFHVRSVEAGRAFQIDGVGGDNAPAPDGLLVWAVPPGAIRVWCGPAQPTESDWVAVAVVDPLRVYAPAELTCESQTRGTNDYPAGARGEQGDPVAIAQRHLRGLRPGDAVSSAGYPATADRTVRVTRVGTNVAIGTYSPDDHGGWLLGAVVACGDSDITWGP